MTISSIETVQSLIEEMRADGTEINSVWEYTNSMNNKRMFAVFPTSQVCDIHQSPFVKEAEIIWELGEFVGKYIYLN